MKRQDVMVIIAVISWLSWDAVAVDGARVMLSISDVTYEQTGGTFSVIATSDFAEPFQPGAFGINLKFDEFSDVTSLNVDFSNQLVGMQELGIAFGTTPHPLEVVAGETIQLVTFGSADVVPGTTALMQVTFTTPADFHPDKQGFQVTVVPNHPSNPQIYQTYVGDGVALSLGSAVIGTIGGGPVFELCDINQDNACDVLDIDALSAAILAGNTTASMDLNQDQVVNQDDHDVWVHDLMNVYFGDSNLDGVFDSTDLIIALQAGQFEDNLPGNAGWSTGDWTGDLEFDTSDLIVAFQDGGYELGPRGAITAVPEPNAITIGVVAAFMGTRMFGRRSAGNRKGCRRFVQLR